MSSTTKKIHVRANCEGRFTDLEQIYSYSFVVPVKCIPKFLKTGLAKIRVHMNVVPRSTMNTNGEQRINSKV